MNSLRAYVAAAALLLIPAVAPAAAPQPAPKPVAAAAAPAAPAPPRTAVDPDTMAALDRMGAALRAHGNIYVKAEVTTEDVLESGEKLQYAGNVEAYAQRPDRFRVSMVSDIKNRQFYYDGKSVTVFSPKLGMYASFDAAPTIRETLEKASSEYGVEFPLADLFTWGTDKSLASHVTSAFLVRPEHIGNQLCNHYALRQDNVDWQVWIADNGIPCKLVITNRADDARPQYTAILHWSFPANIAANTFAFVPPPAAKKIVIARLATPRGSKP